MQLSLFDDNRPQILLNCVDDCLRQLDFDQAEAVMEQIREEYPAEPALPNLQLLLDEWRVRLFDPLTDWSDPAHLQQIRTAALQVSHAALRETVLSAVCDAVLALPQSHHLYLPPDFHIGPLLLERKRYNEAADLLQAALAEQVQPSGKLMTWYANALTILKQGDEALQWYLAACLLDPDEVPEEPISHRQFRDLWASWLTEQDDDDDQAGQPCAAAWLPVWGVLQRLFQLPLPLHLENILLGEQSLINAAHDNSLPLPRLWFFLLLQAEEQRRHRADCSALRRTMKQLHPLLFQHYMELMVHTK